MNATGSTRQSGWAIFGQGIAVVALLVTTAILRGLALAILWGWFVQPLGVRAINVAEAIGLATIIGLLTQREEEEDKKRLPFWDRFVTAFFIGLFGAAFALLIGWIAHLFV